MWNWSASARSGNWASTGPRCRKSFFLNALFVSANMRHAVDGPRGDYVPVFLSEIPPLRPRHPAHRCGAGARIPSGPAWLLFTGVSVDVARAAVRNAGTGDRPGEPNMPRTLGDGQVHVGSSRPWWRWTMHFRGGLLHRIGPSERRIAELVSDMMEDDGSTLQMGIGAIPDAILHGLGDHRDLGVHTEMCSNGIIDLLEQGVISNRFKKKHRGKVVTSFAIGSRRLYDKVDDNPYFAFLDAQYVNDGKVIRENPQGGGHQQRHRGGPDRQVCADSIGTYQYSGSGADGLHAGAAPERRGQAHHRPMQHHRQGAEQRSCPS